MSPIESNKHEPLDLVVQHPQQLLDALDLFAKESDDVKALRFSLEQVRDGTSTETWFAGRVRYVLSTIHLGTMQMYQPGAAALKRWLDERDNGEDYVIELSQHVSDLVDSPLKSMLENLALSLAHDFRDGDKVTALRKAWVTVTDQIERRRSGLQSEATMSDLREWCRRVPFYCDEQMSRRRAGEILPHVDVHITSQMMERRRPVRAKATTSAEIDAAEARRAHNPPSAIDREMSERMGDPASPGTNYDEKARKVDVRPAPTLNERHRQNPRDLFAKRILDLVHDTGPHFADKDDEELTVIANGLRDDSTTGSHAAEDVADILLLPGRFQVFYRRLFVALEDARDELCNHGNYERRENNSNAALAHALLHDLKPGLIAKVTKPYTVQRLNRLSDDLEADQLNWHRAVLAFREIIDEYVDGSKGPGRSNPIPVDTLIAFDAWRARAEELAARVKPDAKRKPAPTMAAEEAARRDAIVARHVQYGKLCTQRGRRHRCRDVGFAYTLAHIASHQGTFDTPERPHKARLSLIADNLVDGSASLLDAARATLDTLHNHPGPAGLQPLSRLHEEHHRGDAYVHLQQWLFETTLALNPSAAPHKPGVVGFAASIEEVLGKPSFSARLLDIIAQPSLHASAAKVLAPLARKLRDEVLLPRDVLGVVRDEVLRNTKEDAPPRPAYRMLREWCDDVDIDLLSDRLEVIVRDGGLVPLQTTRLLALVKAVRADRVLIRVAAVKVREMVASGMFSATPQTVEKLRHWADVVEAGTERKCLVASEKEHLEAEAAMTVNWPPQEVIVEDAKAIDAVLAEDGEPNPKALEAAHRFREDRITPSPESEPMPMQARLSTHDLVNALDDILIQERQNLVPLHHETLKYRGIHFRKEKNVPPVYAATFGKETTIDNIAGEVGAAIAQRALAPPSLKGADEAYRKLQGWLERYVTNKNFRDPSDFVLKDRSPQVTIEQRRNVSAEAPPEPRMGVSSDGIDMPGDIVPNSALVSNVPAKITGAQVSDSPDGPWQDAGPLIGDEGMRPGPTKEQVAAAEQVKALQPRADEILADAGNPPQERSRWEEAVTPKVKPTYAKKGTPPTIAQLQGALDAAVKRCVAMETELRQKMFDEIVAELTKALGLDRAAILAILRHRVPVTNKQLGSDTRFIVGTLPDDESVEAMSVLGLLNGIIEIATGQRVALQLREGSSYATGFTRFIDHEKPQKESP